HARIAARMVSVMADAAEEARGHEAVCVSHQLPIWVARRAAEERRLWHHPGRRECALGSVTSFTYTDGKIIAVSYAEPSVGGRGGAHRARPPSNPLPGPAWVAPASPPPSTGRRGQACPESQASPS